MAESHVSFFKRVPICRFTAVAALLVVVAVAASSPPQCITMPQQQWIVNTSDVSRSFSNCSMNNSMIFLQAPPGPSAVIRNVTLVFDGAYGGGVWSRSGVTLRGNLSGVTIVFRRFSVMFMSAANTSFVLFDRVTNVDSIAIILEDTTVNIQVSTPFPFVVSASPTLSGFANVSLSTRNVSFFTSGSVFTSGYATNRYVLFVYASVGKAVLSNISATAQNCTFNGIGFVALRQPARGVAITVINVRALDSATALYSVMNPTQTLVSHGANAFMEREVVVAASVTVSNFAYMMTCHTGCSLKNVSVVLQNVSASSMTFLIEVRGVGAVPETQLCACTNTSIEMMGVFVVRVSSPIFMVNVSASTVAIRTTDVTLIDTQDAVYLVQGTMRDVSVVCQSSYFSNSAVATSIYGAIGVYVIMSMSWVDGFSLVSNSVFADVKDNANGGQLVRFRPAIGDPIMIINSSLSIALTNVNTTITTGVVVYQCRLNSSPLSPQSFSIVVLNVTQTTVGTSAYVPVVLTVQEIDLANGMDPSAPSGWSINVSLFNVQSIDGYSVAFFSGVAGVDTSHVLLRNIVAVRSQYPFYMYNWGKGGVERCFVAFDNVSLDGASSNSLRVWNSVDVDELHITETGSNIYTSKYSATSLEVSYITARVMNISCTGVSQLQPQVSGGSSTLVSLPCGRYLWLYGNTLDGIAVLVQDITFRSTGAFCFSENMLTVANTQTSINNNPSVSSSPYEYKFTLVNIVFRSSIAWSEIATNLLIVDGGITNATNNTFVMYSISVANATLLCNSMIKIALRSNLDVMNGYFIVVVTNVTIAAAKLLEVSISPSVSNVYGLILDSHWRDVTVTLDDAILWVGASTTYKAIVSTVTAVISIVFSQTTLCGTGSFLPRNPYTNLTNLTLVGNSSELFTTWSVPTEVTTQVLWNDCSPVAFDLNASKVNVSAICLQSNLLPPPRSSLHEVVPALFWPFSKRAYPCVDTATWSVSSKLSHTSTTTDQVGSVTKTCSRSSSVLTSFSLNRGVSNTASVSVRSSLSGTTQVSNDVTVSRTETVSRGHRSLSVGVASHSRSLRGLTVTHSPLGTSHTRSLLWTTSLSPRGSFTVTWRLPLSSTHAATVTTPKTHSLSWAYPTATAESSATITQAVPHETSVTVPAAFMQTSQVINAAAAAASIVSSLAAAGGESGTLGLISLMRCSRSTAKQTTGPLSYLLSPFVDYGFVWMVWGNVGLCVLCCALHYVAYQLRHFVSRSENTPTDNTATDVELPVLSGYDNDDSVVGGSAKLNVGVAGPPPKPTSQKERVAVIVDTRKLIDRHRTGWAEKVRYPALSITLSLLFSSGTMVASFGMLWSWASAWTVVTAVVGVSQIVAIVAVARYQLHTNVLRLLRFVPSVADSDVGGLAERLASFVFPVGQWYPKSLRQTHGCVFAALLPEKVTFFSGYTTAYSVVVCLLASIEPPTAQCWLPFAVISLWALVFAARVTAAALRADLERIRHCLVLLRQRGDVSDVHVDAIAAVLIAGHGDACVYSAAVDCDV